MSISIDRKYLLLLSPKLNRFVQKKEDLFNFRCPFCGDSQKNLLKARGYIYRKRNDYFYKCQNCGIGHTMYNFVNLLDPTLSKEYSLERYREGENGNHNYPKPINKETPTFETPKFKTKISLPNIASLDELHYARQYVKNRFIPEKFWNDLYYAEDFKSFVESYGIDKELKDDDPRLIIPFYDENKNLIAFQGRALTDTKIRYITIKFDENTHKLFGMDRVNKNQKVYVVEGPIDSLFLENSIATADSSLTAVDKHIDKMNLVLIYDNEPRNKDLCKQMNLAIENHFNICIWPEMIEEKDINEMIKSGFTSEEIQDIIDSNTFVNLRAKMEFVAWKKC